MVFFAMCRINVFVHTSSMRKETTAGRCVYEFETLEYQFWLLICYCWSKSKQTDVCICLVQGRRGREKQYTANEVMLAGISNRLCACISYNSNIKIHETRRKEKASTHHTVARQVYGFELDFFNGFRSIYISVEMTA